MSACHKMKREALFLLFALALGGCLPGQVKAKDMASCRIEVDRFYQGYNTVDVNNPRSQYIIACMTAKGYDFDVSSADCDSRHPLASQSSCYVHRSWLALIVDQFRGTH